MNGSIPETAPRDTHRDAAEHFIVLLRTLADPIRLRIMRLLECGPQGGSGGAGSGLSVGELSEILKLPQSTVSRHLKTLGDAGLADARRDGTSTYYRLSDAAGQNAGKQLRTLARAQLEQDPVTRSDAHRLASVLRKRESAAESFFGKHAPHWDQLRAQWFGDTFHLEGLLALLNPQWVVADIGTGTGAMLPLLSPHVKQVIAVDPSSAMLRGARQRITAAGLANIDVRQGAAEALPIEKSSVDVALLALILAYTAEPPLVLREVRRILKPGGVLLAIDLQPHAVDLFREKLNHRHMGFSQEDLSRWLADAGFAAMRWHPLSPENGRSKESSTPIPDLFALRAEVPA